MLFRMFRTIASLLLFGTLSPVSPSLSGSAPPVFLAVAPPPSVPRVEIHGRLSASGVVMLDVLSGKELFARAPDEPRAIASLAKVMTALLILEQHALTEAVTVPEGVEAIEGNIAGLRSGERYTVSDLLGALLVGSANDAAYALAVMHSGSSGKFAEAMSARALALGLRRTRFENPMGFDHPDQISTPRDLGWLALFAWKNDVIRSLVSRRSYTLFERSEGRSFTLHNTNQLLSSHPSAFFGLKTGTTVEAGECLMSLAMIGGRAYIFVVLKSSDRYRDTLELLHSLSPRHA